MSLLKSKESPITMLPRLVSPAKLATDKRSAAIELETSPPSEVSMHQSNASLEVRKAIHSSSRENEQNDLIVQHSDHTGIEHASKVQLPVLSLCTRSECAEQLHREYNDARETSEIVVRLFHEFIENNHTKQLQQQYCYHHSNQNIRNNKNINYSNSNSNSSSSMVSLMNEYYYLFDTHRHNNNINGTNNNNSFNNNNNNNNNNNVSKMRKVHDKHITEMTLRAAISCFVLYKTIHELPRHQSVLLPYIDMLVGYVFIPQTNLVHEALKHYHHTFQSHFAFMKPISEKHRAITNNVSNNVSENTSANVNVNQNSNTKPTTINNNNQITTTDAIINRDNNSTHVISLPDRLHEEVSNMHENTTLYHILEPYIQMPYFVAYKVLTKRVIMLAHQVRGRELHVARLPEIFNMTYLHRGAQLLRLVMHVWRSLVRRRRAEEVKHRTRWTLRRSRAMQSTVIKYWRSYASYTMEAAQVDSKVKVKIYEMQENIRQCKGEISSMLSHSSSLSQFIQDKNKERKDVEVHMSALEQQYKKNLEYVRSMDSVGTLLLNSLLLPHSLPECVRYNLHLINKNYTYENKKYEELAQDAQWHASAHALYILVQWGNYMVNKRGRETEELCAILPSSTPATEVLVVEGKEGERNRIEQVHKMQEKERKESNTDSTTQNKTNSIDSAKKISISLGRKHNSEMSNTHFDMLLTSYDQTDESDWHTHKLERNNKHHHRKEEEQEGHEAQVAGGSVLLDVSHIESHNIQNDNDNNTNSNSVVSFPLYKFLVLMRCVALNEDEMPPLTVVRMVKSADDTVLEELNKVMRNRQNYSSRGHNVDHNNNRTSDASPRNSVQRLNVHNVPRRVSRQSLQRATSHRSSLEKEEEEEEEYQEQEEEEELLEDEAMIIINSLSKEIRSTAERVAHILIDSYEHLTHTVSLISVEQLLSRKRSVLLLFLASLMRYYTNWIVRHQDSALAITTQPLNETSTESSENELDLEESSEEEEEEREEKEKMEDNKQPSMGNKMCASTSNAEKVNKGKNFDTDKDEDIHGKFVNGKEKTAAHKRRKRHSNLQLDVGKRHVQYSEWSYPPKSHLRWKRKITEQQEWIAFSFSALHVALQSCIRVKPPMLTLEEQESFNELIRSLSLSLLADILPSESDLMTSYYLNYIYVLESNYRQLRFTFQQHALPYNAMQSARRNLYMKENSQYEENSPISRSSVSGTAKTLQNSNSNNTNSVSKNGKSENNNTAQHHKNKNISLEEDSKWNEKYITSLSVWHLLCNCKMAGSSDSARSNSNSGDNNKNIVQTRLHRAQVMSVIEHVVFRTLNCNTATNSNTNNNNNNKNKSEKWIANNANNNINEANQLSGHVHKNRTNKSRAASSSSPSSLFAQGKSIIQIGNIRQIPHYARAIQEERHVDIRNDFLTLVMNEIQFIEVLLRCAHAWQCLHEAKQIEYKRQMQKEHETNTNLALLHHQKLQSQNEKSLSTFEQNKEEEKEESEEYDKYKNKEVQLESCDISARFNDDENENSRSNLLRRGSVSSEESLEWLSSTTESVSANWTNPNMSLTSTQETSQIFPHLSSPHSRAAMNKDKHRRPINHHHHHHQQHRSNNNSGNNTPQTKERRRTLAVKEKIKYESCDYATPLHPSVLSCFVFKHIIPFTMYAHSLLAPLQYDMQSHEVLQIIAQHQEEWCTLFARYSRPCEAIGMRSALPPPFAYEVHKQLNTTLLNSTLSGNFQNQTINKSNDMFNSKSTSFANVNGNNPTGLMNSYDRRKRSMTSMQSYKLASSMRHNTFTLIEQNENNNNTISINENSNTKTLNAQGRRRSSLLRPSLSLQGTVSQTHTARAVRDVGIVSVMTESEILTLAKELNWRRCIRLSEEVLLLCFHHVLCDTQREVHCLFCSEFIVFLCALCYYYDPNPLTPLSDKLERFLNELVLSALRLSNVYELSM